MADIILLDQNTIDRIAAGEVIERPSSVVKELIENSIDAGATAITAEIKEGGISLIRITDNGCGMEKNQVPLAFLRHSTSKIRSVEDLLAISSLGFRGEALSSIASVAQVELITKTAPDLTGIRYVIEGSKEKEKEEIGAPDGTTFLVRNLFYNTPARRRFLKTPQTEAGYIYAFVEHLALSRPDISFQLIVNNQTKLHTSGNSSIKDVIYQIYGRDITSSLMEIKEENDIFSMEGYIGKPEVSRGNRNFEHYFVNGRYIQSALLSKSIEEAYKSFLMQHQYPFCVLYFTINGQLLDVNVHPAKMEIRFSRQEEIYQNLSFCIKEKLMKKEHILSASFEKDPVKKTPQKKEQPKPKTLPEPFEKRRLEIEKEPKMPAMQPPRVQEPKVQEPKVQEPKMQPQPKEEYVQEEIPYEGKFLSSQARQQHKLIGQIFETYWLAEYQEKLFIIDQHAAHEKVLYEKMLRSFNSKEVTVQMISPPIILTLDAKEEEALLAIGEELNAFGFEIEPFGGREYAICGVPGNLLDLDARAILLEVLNSHEGIKKAAVPDLALEKIASMACKAAVKGNHLLKQQEARELIGELLELENPYFCPHGRPTIISMSKHELEKKFKRII